MTTTLIDVKNPTKQGYLNLVEIEYPTTWGIKLKTVKDQLNQPVMWIKYDRNTWIISDDDRAWLVRHGNVFWPFNKIFHIPEKNIDKIIKFSSIEMEVDENINIYKNTKLKTITNKESYLIKNEWKLYFIKDNEAIDLWISDQCSYSLNVPWLIIFKNEDNAYLLFNIEKKTFISVENKTVFSEIKVENSYVLYDNKGNILDENNEDIIKRTIIPVFVKAMEDLPNYKDPNYNEALRNARINSIEIWDKNYKIYSAAHPSINASCCSLFHCFIVENDWKHNKIEQSEQKKVSIYNNGWIPVFPQVEIIKISKPTESLEFNK